MFKTTKIVLVIIQRTDLTTLKIFQGVGEITLVESGCSVCVSKVYKKKHPYVIDIVACGYTRCQTRKMSWYIFNEIYSNSRYVNRNKLFLMMKICTEWWKLSVIGSALNVESGEKYFQSYNQLFRSPIVKMLIESLVFWNPHFLQYFSIFRRKIIFYLNEQYIFGFHKKAHKKNCSNLMKDKKIKKHQFYLFTYIIYIHLAS